MIVQPPEKPEAFSQPQHRLETGNRSPRRVEGLKPPIFGMFFFTRK
ncbi:hypothetical protein ACOJBM_01945 [Rhizobium beringeri]